MNNYEAEEAPEEKKGRTITKQKTTIYIGAFDAFFQWYSTWAGACGAIIIHSVVLEPDTQCIKYTGLIVCMVAFAIEDEYTNVYKEWGANGAME